MIRWCHACLAHTQICLMVAAKRETRSVGAQRPMWWALGVAVAGAGRHASQLSAACAGLKLSPLYAD